MSRVFEVLSAAVHENKNPAKPEARGTFDHREFPMNEHEVEAEDRRHFHSKRSWVLALLAAGAALIMGLPIIPCESAPSKRARSTRAHNLDVT